MQRCYTKYATLCKIKGFSYFFSTGNSRSNCLILDDKPTPSPTLPVSPGDYIHRECGGVNLKYIGSSAPADVLKHLNFRLKKFTSGYFGTLEEEGGSVKKVRMKF